MFGDHPRSLPPPENDGLWPLLMIILVLLGFSWSSTNPKLPPHSGTSITLEKCNSIQILQSYRVITVVSFKTTLLMSSYPLKELFTKGSMLTPPTKWGCRTKNHHLLEVACSLMLSISLPSYLWDDVILTVTYLINWKKASLCPRENTPLIC